MRVAAKRAIGSVLPPGGYGTMKRIGLVGYACAEPVEAAGCASAAFEAASNAELKPRKLEGTLAFMFETRFPQRVTRFAAETPSRQASYGDYGQALKRYFDPAKR